MAPSRSHRKKSGRGPVVGRGLGRPGQACFLGLANPGGDVHGMGDAVDPDCVLDTALVGLELGLALVGLELALALVGLELALVGFESPGALFRLLALGLRACDCIASLLRKKSSKTQVTVLTVEHLPL